MLQAPFLVLPETLGVLKARVVVRSVGHCTPCMNRHFFAGSQ